MLYIFFLLYRGPTLPEPADVMEQHGALEAKSKARKAYVCWRPFVTDGPFAETKEILCGIYVIDCRDRDEALEYARQIPDAQFGAVEVRPIEYPEDSWLNR